MYLRYRTYFEVVDPVLDLKEIGNIRSNLFIGTLLKWVTEEVPQLKAHDNIHQKVSCKTKIYDVAIVKIINKNGRIYHRANVC